MQTAPAAFQVELGEDFDLVLHKLFLATSFDTHAQRFDEAQHNEKGLTLRIPRVFAGSVAALCT